MDGWGYVILAYGIVWTALVVYWLSLKRRLQRAEAKLSHIESSPKMASHG
jgi:CcmD family protein